MEAVQAVQAVTVSTVTHHLSVKALTSSIMTGPRCLPAHLIKTAASSPLPATRTRRHRAPGAIRDPAESGTDPGDGGGQQVDNFAYATSAESH